MQINLADVEVINNPAERRFEAQVGEYLAVIDYVPEEKLIIYTHTGVPEEIGHHGIASKMARVALDYARDNNLKVIPQCPFIAGYISLYPEYQSLVWDPKSQTAPE